MWLQNHRDFFSRYEKLGVKLGRIVFAWPYKYLLDLWHAVECDGTKTVTVGGYIAPAEDLESSRFYLLCDNFFFLFAQAFVWRHHDCPHTIQLRQIDI